MKRNYNENEKIDKNNKNNHLKLGQIIININDNNLDSLNNNNFTTNSTVFLNDSPNLSKITFLKNLVENNLIYTMIILSDERLALGGEKNSIYIFSKTLDNHFLINIPNNLSPFYQLLLLSNKNLLACTEKTFFIIKILDDHYELIQQIDCFKQIYKIIEVRDEKLIYYL